MPDHRSFRSTFLKPGFKLNVRPLWILCITILDFIFVSLVWQRNPGIGNMLEEVPHYNDAFKESLLFFPAKYTTLYSKIKSDSSHDIRERTLIYNKDIDPYCSTNTHQLLSYSLLVSSLDLSLFFFVIFLCLCLFLCESEDDVSEISESLTLFDLSPDSESWCFLFLFLCLCFCFDSFFLSGDLERDRLLK